MSSLQDKVTEIRQLVEKRVVNCPEVFDLRIPPGHPESCYCHGMGLIPDPAYADLLAVLREKAYYEVEGTSIPRVVRGWATRQWEGMPKGALWGSLKYWAKQQFEMAPNCGKIGRISDLCNRLGLCAYDDNPDGAACEALIKWLKL